MPGNMMLIQLAIVLFIVGVVVSYSNRSRPNGIAHNFGLIVMINGALIFGGICLFTVLSAFTLAWL